MTLNIKRRLRYSGEGRWQMTIEEILNCEISGGIYKLALDHLRESILHFDSSSFYEKHENDFLVASLVVSFSDIYKIANFQKIIPQTEHDKRGHQSIIYLMGYKEGLKNMERIKDHKGEK